MNNADPHDLRRFEAAQHAIITAALAELRAGLKTSHWMWFVFPQFAGLGRSPTAARFAIRSADEARAYLAHPVLGPRLRDAVGAMLSHRERSAEAILGSVDAIKLRSSMTLFAAVAEDPTPFRAVLDAFYHGDPDPETLRLMRS